MIEPGAVVVADGLHDEGVSLPAAHGISVPGRIGILRKRPAIGPDRAPDVVILHVLQHAVGHLNELKGPQIRLPQIARIAQGLALGNRIVVQLRLDRARAVADFIGVKFRFSPRRHRRRRSIGPHLRRDFLILDVDPFIVQGVPFEIAGRRGRGPHAGQIMRIEGLRARKVLSAIPPASTLPASIPWCRTSVQTRRRRIQQRHQDQDRIEEVDCACSISFGNSLRSCSGFGFQ